MIPNILTFLRLLLAPVMVVLILSHHWVAATFLFLAAGVSDVLDGLIARRFEMRSTLGACIDPIADKALLVCSYVALSLAGILPIWLTGIVVARDILITLGIVALWFAGRFPTIKPLIMGKISTLAQISLVILALAFSALKIEFVGLIPAFFIYSVALFSILSVIAYAHLWFQHIKG
jgi:cardiolipin synthase